MNRTRTYTWEDPRATAAAALTMSGMEFLGAISRCDLPKPPIAETLGFEEPEFEEGRATFWLTPSEYRLVIRGEGGGG